MLVIYTLSRKFFVFLWDTLTVRLLLPLETNSTPTYGSVSGLVRRRIEGEVPKL